MLFKLCIWSIYSTVPQNMQSFVILVVVTIATDFNFHICNLCCPKKTATGYFFPI